MTRPILWILLLSLAAGPSLAEVPPNLEHTLEAQRAKVSSEPGNSVAWNDLGNLLVLAERLSEAEDAYQRALSIAPDELPPRFNLALLLQQTGRPKEAESELGRLLELDPRHAWAHYQLGTILAERREREKALDHYARALAYDPGLSFSGNNPHIIDNKLFSEALLMSQRYSREPGSKVPRQYGEADRIVDLMLEAQGEAEEGEKAGEEGEAEEGADVEGLEAEDVGGGSGATAARGAVPPGEPSAPAAAPRSAAVQPASRPGSGSAASRGGAAQPVPVQGGLRQAPPPPSAGQADREGRTASQTATPRTVIPPSRATPTPAPSPGRSDPNARSVPPPPPRATRQSPPPPPPRSSRYIPPSRRSSAQLELKLLPEEPPQRYASVESG